MKHLLQGVVVTVVILIVLIAVNMFCNMHGVELDATATGTTAAICAVAFDRTLSRNERKKES